MDITLTLRKELGERLAQLPSANIEADRDALRQAIAAWREERLVRLRAEFEKSGDAPVLLSGLTAVMDAIQQVLFSLCLPSSIGVALLATGGYGRRELFPYSDIDLLVLYRPATRAAAERMARLTLYVLWDLGLKVGHALRSVEDTIALAKDDLTICTNLLDARLIAGDADLFAEMQGRYQEEIVAPGVEQFVDQKLAERDARHDKLGNSRYLLEPNIKESKGGLRDLHTLHWIARFAYGAADIAGLSDLGYITRAEWTAFQRSERFLWKLRAHLHYLAGKAEERLTFDKQQALAPRMGFKGREGALAVERLMKSYFMAARSVGSFTRVLCALLEDQHRRKPRQPLAMRLNAFWKLDGFTLEGERLNIKPEEDFADNPLRMLKLFAVAEKHGYDIHPHALREVARHLKRIDALREDAAANATFMDMLLSPHTPGIALKRLNEVGLLGRFIPEFGRIVAQMQFNMYHIYTVDEHTIVALSELHAILSGQRKAEAPVATHAAKRVKSRRVVMLALLCHDLAKGGERDHSEEGAEIALAMARRFGLTPAEQEMTAWLVKHHLLFTHTAFKRDVNDPQTLKDFVDIVQTQEKLRLLLILTVADMRAVGPGVWNAWKATLLRSLYAQAEARMLGQPETQGETQALAESLSSVLPAARGAQITSYIAQLAPGMAEALPPEAHARVLLNLPQVVVEPSHVVIDVWEDSARAVTELMVLTPDKPGLFAALSGALALSGANILSAKIFTLADGTAVDLFTLQDSSATTDKLSRLQTRLRQCVAGMVDIDAELARQKSPYPARREVFEVPGQVFIENDASATHTVVEVVGRDRVGFLYRVTKQLSESGLQISSAHISTYGVQAVDVFYVKDNFGMKILHPEKLTELRQKLLEAVES